MRVVVSFTVLMAMLGALGVSQVNPPRASGDAGRISLDPTSPSPLAFAGGTVEGRTRETELRFETSGRLESIAVRLGQQVKAGDVVARVGSSLWEAELAVAQTMCVVAEAERELLINGASKEERRTAKAHVLAAQVRLEHAERSHRRAAGLPDTVLSKQALDDHKNQVRTAHAAHAIVERRWREVEAAARDDQLAIATAKIAMQYAKADHAERKLEQTLLHAPCDGMVLRIDAEPGDLVGPAQSEPVIVMVDASELRVRAFVEELDAVRIQVGMAATIFADGIASEAIIGEVVTLAPTMSQKVTYRNDPQDRNDSKVREVLVRLASPPSQLVIGLPVDVTFYRPATSDSADTVWVP